MTAFRVSRQVRAQPAEVFARATDLPRATQTIRAITRMEILTEGPVGLGTRFRETRMMFGREASETMELTAFEPPRRVVIGCESHGCRYRTELLCEPRDGGTELTMSFDATPLTAFAKVMSFLMRPMMKSMTKTCAQDLDDIKAAAEGRSPGA